MHHLFTDLVLLLSCIFFSFFLPPQIITCPFPSLFCNKIISKKKFVYTYVLMLPEEGGKALIAFFPKGY